MNIIIRFVLASVIFVFSMKVLAANGDTTDDILYGLFLLYKAWKGNPFFDFPKANVVFFFRMEV